MSQKLPSNVALAKLLVALVCILPLSGCLASSSYADIMQRCQDSTGLKLKDIIKWNSRNDKCIVDCVTRQGIEIASFAPDGQSCVTEKPGYRCVLGVCRTPEERPSTKGLYSTSISILSAFVPDLDPAPLQGESDVFVSVEIYQGAEPAYNDQDLLCYTNVIQDNNSPTWAPYTCKPGPLKLNSSMLKFTAFDSDKPLENPDVVGYAFENLSYLMNAGPKKLKLLKGDQTYSPYWVEVDVKGTEYTSAESQK